MPLLRIGQCSNCGKCCMPPVMVENPMIDRGEDRCKFYTEIEGTEKYGHCLIIGSWAPIEFARDRSGNRITPEQINWFNQNCIDYPLAEDLEAGRCPSECSFNFEVA